MQSAECENLQTVVRELSESRSKAACQRAVLAEKYGELQSEYHRMLRIADLSRTVRWVGAWAGHIVHRGRAGEGFLGGGGASGSGPGLKRLALVPYQLSVLLVILSFPASLISALACPAPRFPPPAARRTWRPRAAPAANFGACSRSCMPPRTMR